MDAQRELKAHGLRGAYLAGVAMLCAASGCGVRCNQMLVDEPMPIGGNGAAPVCQAAETKSSFAAPSWLVRCRRDWHRWRHGEEAAVERSEFIVPPSPRYHPVPTRPVFAPLEFEAPPGFSMPAATEQPSVEAPKPIEEVPAPQASTPEPPKPDPPPGVEDSARKSELLIAPPRLMPRTLTTKPTTASRPASRPVEPPSNRSMDSEIPEAPKAEAPLSEAAARPTWKARR